MRKITIFLICFISIFASSAVFAHSSRFGDKLARVCFDYLGSESRDPHSYNMEPLEVQEWNNDEVDGYYNDEGGLLVHFAKIQQNLGVCDLYDGFQKINTAYAERSNNTLVFKYW